MMLAREDQALLREILNLGHELERAWLDSNPQATGLERETLPLSLFSTLKKFEDLLRKAKLAASPDLQRLERWADHLDPKMSARHFLGILVPFERLSQRALRDDEFLSAHAPDSQEKSYRKLPFVGVLENLRSAFNVGAVFRTAECWGLERLVLSGYTPDPDDEKLAKTAMGTANDVVWARATTTSEAANTLKSQGYTLVALETVPTAEVLTHFEFPEKSALLVGNERFGLDPDSIASADRILRIPLRGRKNSLNVGIAFGIAAYEYAKQWGEK